MKATKLMIGDWVLHFGKVAQIAGIRVDCGKYFRTNIHDTWYESGVDGIEPIPLTPEILEKNGFKNIPPSVTWEREYGVDMAVRINPNEPSIYTSSRKPYHIQIGSIMYSMPLVYMSFTYVHQLQHALRLCGITKEITL